MTTKEIRDKVEDVYIKETGRVAFLDENKLDDRYVEWLENQVMNNFVLDLVSVPLPDHYEGELNTERIKAYRFEAEKWNLHEDSIGKIFCAGADWYKSKCNER